MPAVLVLDNDRQSADHLCHLLALLGLPAIPAYTWRAGMLLLEEDLSVEGGSIEIVFLGISDEDEVGVEHASSNHLNFSAYKISVILVAHAESKNLVERMAQVGAKATIAKPVTLESVASVLLGLNLIEKN